MTLVDGREPSRGPESQLGDWYEQARQQRWLGGFRGATSLPVQGDWGMSEQGLGRKHRASRPRYLRGGMSKNQIDGPPEWSGSGGGSSGSDGDESGGSTR